MIWISFEMPPGAVRQWRVGPLDLWLQHTQFEWRSGNRFEGERRVQDTAECASLPDGVDIRRWSVDAAAGSTVFLRPLMPDRPVIVRPAAPVTILPGSAARFFVSIPVWLAVHLGTETGLRLLETPTEALSNSWFGLPTDGELCYALRSRARRCPEEEAPMPNRVICPITVHNHSATALPFLRLCLRVAPLRIYRGEKHLWTNSGAFHYHGEDKSSPIVYDQGAPEFDHAESLLSEAREETHAGFISKSFGGLRGALNIM